MKILLLSMIIIFFTNDVNQDMKFFNLYLDDLVEVEIGLVHGEANFEVVMSKSNKSKKEEEI